MQNMDLNSIIVWIYRQDIFTCMIFIIIFTMIFSFFYLRFKVKSCWKIFSSIGLVCYLLILIYITIKNRTVNYYDERYMMIPLESYYRAIILGERELLRSCFMNCMLFYPIGVFMEMFLPQNWKLKHKVLVVSIIACIISGGIEICQFLFGLGIAEIDDLINNIMGACFGTIVLKMCRIILEKIDKSF